jgi:hypothetical protein
MLIRVEDLTQIYDVEFPLEDAKVAVPIALAGCGKPATGCGGYATSSATCPTGCCWADVIFDMKRASS